MLKKPRAVRSDATSFPSPDYVEGSSRDHTTDEMSAGDEEQHQQHSGAEDLDGDDSGSSVEAGAASANDGKTVKPLSATALAEFERAQRQAGIIYISRIPPGMRPAKVKHLMSGYGKIGRVYLQQEDPKRAYLRKKHTATKKVQYTEGWVEFESKHVARSVAEMLNAQPIGGKKGTRWRDDIWTMKYLPKFKWNMLTEQVGKSNINILSGGRSINVPIAQEAAAHTARLRVELSQSRAEQREYLRNVELARVLDKRAKRKQNPGSEDQVAGVQSEQTTDRVVHQSKKPRGQNAPFLSGLGKSDALNSVLSNIF